MKKLIVILLSALILSGCFPGDKWDAAKQNGKKGYVNCNK